MKLNETTIRNKAKRMGYIIYKSKAAFFPGGYMLAKANNTVVLGSNFDASLEDIAEYLKSLMNNGR